MQNNKENMPLHELMLCISVLNEAVNHGWEVLRHDNALRTSFLLFIWLEINLHDDIVGPIFSWSNKLEESVSVLNLNRVRYA